MLTHLMKISTCERTDSTPSADEFYLLSMLVQSQHMLGVNKIRYETTICDKWEQHMDWGPLNKSPYMSTSGKLPSPFQTLAEVRNWARLKNLPVLPLLAALCSMSTHILHSGRRSFYWHCLNCIVTVQGLSTLYLSLPQSSLYQRREAQKGERITYTRAVFLRCSA